MGKSIKEIKEELNCIDINDINSFVEEYCADERSGVVALVHKAKNIYNDYQAE